MRAVASLLLILFLTACAKEEARYIEPETESACVTKVIEHEYLVKFRDARGVQKLKLDPTRMAELRQNRSVSWIEPNYAVDAPGARPAFFYNGLGNPNALVIGADYAWSRGIRGQGITVAVVDSGVDTNHPLLAGRIVKTWNFVDGGETVRDETGHGTHIAGIIGASRVDDFSGVAPAVNLIAADFMNEDRGDEFNAIKAIEFSIRNGARIINNSWSNFCSYSIRSAFESWQSANVLFVNAAGNDSLRIDELSIFPANLKLPNGVTVGSVDSFGRRSVFSNYGRNVVVYAPGEEIYSLGTTEFRTRYLVPRSGTSMSTAFVSGALALVWSARPELTAQELVERLREGPMPQNSDRSPVIDVRKLLRAN